MSKKWLGKVKEENGWTLVEFYDAQGNIAWLDLVKYEKTLAIGQEGGSGCVEFTKAQARCLINHLESWIKTGELR